MKKYFVKTWDENKQKLEEYFKTHKQEEYCTDYKTIFQKTLEYVVNGYKGENFNYSDDDIKVVDYGDYQGTLIFIFSEETYQPTENQTYYTTVYYGSCSGCDTLQAIHEYDYDEVPNKEQLEDYMTLALHLIQHIKCFGESDLERE